MCPTMIYCVYSYNYSTNPFRIRLLERKSSFLLSDQYHLSLVFPLSYNLLSFLPILLFVILCSSSSVFCPLFFVLCCSSVFSSSLFFVLCDSSSVICPIFFSLCSSSYVALLSFLSPLLFFFCCLSSVLFSLFLQQSSVLRPQCFCPQSSVLDPLFFVLCFILCSSSCVLHFCFSPSVLCVFALSSVLCSIFFILYSSFCVLCLLFFILCS